VMKGKNEEGDLHAGRFTSLSAVGATLASEHALEAFQNLKLRVGDADGDLYAKVIATGDAYRLRFTAVPPAVERAIAAHVAPAEPERSTELAERS